MNTEFNGFRFVPHAEGGVFGVKVEINHEGLWQDATDREILAGVLVLIWALRLKGDDVDVTEADIARIRELGVPRAT